MVSNLDYTGQRFYSEIDLAEILIISTDFVITFRTVERQIVKLQKW